jgi:hypothetical protein
VLVLALDKAMLPDGFKQLIDKSSTFSRVAGTSARRGYLKRAFIRQASAESPRWDFEEGNAAKLDYVLAARAWTFWSSTSH